MKYLLNIKNELIGGACGTTLSAVGTATQTNETLQTISLIITIIGAIISMIIIPIVTWYHNAKKDGKIDKEEIKEGVDTLQEGLEGVKHILDDKKKGDKNGTHKNP